MFPKHQEMLGSEAQECGVSFLLEWTGIEVERSEDMSVHYVLYRYNKLCGEIFLNSAVSVVKCYLSSVLFLGDLHLISFKVAA